MQTFITDRNFYKSASNLDIKRLGSQIYEAIQILASLLNVNDKLVNPKRSVSNHPAAKLWIDYEYELLLYIDIHRQRWYNIGYKSIINEKNFEYLYEYMGCLNNFEKYKKDIKIINIPWITDELIQIHRSVLIQKKPEHYRNLWSDCPDNLVMRYDFRS